MDGYLVFGGNEFGAEMDEEHEFISLEDAEPLYEKYLKEYGAASMYKFTGYSIQLVKIDSDF